MDCPIRLIGENGKKFFVSLFPKFEGLRVHLGVKNDVYLCFLANWGCGRKVGPSRAVGLEFACIAKRT